MWYFVVFIQNNVTLIFGCKKKNQNSFVTAILFPKIQLDLDQARALLIEILIIIQFHMIINARAYIHKCIIVYTHTPMNINHEYPMYYAESIYNYRIIKIYLCWVKSVHDYFLIGHVIRLEEVISTHDYTII